MLQSPRLKYQVKTIGIDESLSKNALFELKCPQNIKKLYKHAGKCDNQKQFKYILEASMVSTPEGLTDNIPISPTTPTPVKEPSARKLPCLFTTILDMKKKAANHRVGAAKSKRKAINAVTTPW